MTSPAAQYDPYVLPLPTPQTPVVLPQWISAGNTHSNSRYCDAVWPLAPLIDNPSTYLVKIHWRQCPALLLGEMKLITWTMINGRLRPTHLKARGAGARARTSAHDLRDTHGEWIRLARWLHERRITRLVDCTDHVWRTYIVERCSDVSRGHAEKICSMLTDLWAFDQLSAEPVGATRPPWDSEGVDDFLPPAGGSDRGENSTEPLDPQVLGPLLVWAIRFVDIFADDILAAWSERCQLFAVAAVNQASAESHAALEEFLLPRVGSGAPLPSIHFKGRSALARTYIAALTGASTIQVNRFATKHQLHALVPERPGACPLNVPILGQIDGKPWRDHIDVEESAE
ncbi:hypothetical protein [Streptomyces sp. NBC_00091]|uniref:hypothetical protein n=1 Tax=Streptomyces sp. NBC_00091 TaxID=2975648 RepID=UPI002B1D6A5F|nr:hypothetical protein [Streptomyces sp. NBC_00091]